MSMKFSEYLIFGLRDGVCVASAWKMMGPGSEEYNTETAYTWVSRGMKVFIRHKDHPDAERYFDQIRDSAKAAVERAKQ